MMKKRAINDNQKQQRRQVILAQAWSLFQQMPYEAINIQDVAAACGLAKGTLYLYFNTKESLFLAVMTEQFQTWFDSIDAALAPPHTLDSVVDAITESLMTRPHFVRLFAILHVILERNISAEDALPFKQFLLQRITRTGQLLEDALPTLADGTGAEALLQAYAVAIGVEHIANPAPIVAQVIAQNPDLGIFDVRFSATFSAILRAILTHLSGD